MIVCNTALLEDLLASLRKEQQKLEAEAERLGDGDLPPAGFTFAPMLLWVSSMVALHSDHLYVTA
jgi:hypothetical protein